MASRLRSACLRAASVLALIGVASAALASSGEEVRLSHGAHKVRAVLELSPGKTLADGVVVMLHGTMGHHDMDVMRRFRTLLGGRGHSTLAVTLSLGIDAREGVFDCAWPNTHQAADALAEIDVWIDWAARQGARRIVLLGFSRGGQQAAWYASRQPHPRLGRVVLLAPIVAGDFAERYEARFGQPLAVPMAAAKKLQADGSGATVLRDIGFLNCDRTAVSAASFLSYYAAPGESELPSTLPRIGLPTLVVVAGGDVIVRDLDRRIGAHVDGQRRQMAVVTGADHFFHDLYGEDAADAIDAFLRR